ncbi:L-serine ammonia-lyase [Candidatus Ichthyocystis hellenicum]|uniref:L-serine ammonia-lyase n=1 Tax=Candidatus Ichthyocystis hellenicum TaxID=1561003 RepID=UPI000A8878EB|nr:L-serine ammonia-lyase [Candidatus Ichthyocystis hellenicum]
MKNTRYLSMFEMFKIGIGPSSSHTVGPMKASAKFISESLPLLDKTTSIHIILHGSLAATGKGHGTDKAVIAGLMGCLPETVDPTEVVLAFDKAVKEKSICLSGKKTVPFNYDLDIVFDKIPLQFHPNAVTLSLIDEKGNSLTKKTYFSVGGGFIQEEGEANRADNNAPENKVPYPFQSANELLQLCHTHKLTISEIVLENELSFQSYSEIKDKVLHIWKTMGECIETGCHTEGVLPGGMDVPRRAPDLFKKLSAQNQKQVGFLETCDWINLYAMAVNEQNAAGGRVVTAPTNGAAGIIPAVIKYSEVFLPNFNEEKILQFFFTATAIGILFKTNASISGAEVGCQGEVGSASSMAAAGLAAIMGGTPLQVENAAEIAIEHSLGLTCDPIGGLVQIPCIERNAIASVKSVNAARLALNGTGSHQISLDSAIETMKETGKDMQKKYKETSEGGLAVHFKRTVNFINC